MWKISALKFGSYIRAPHRTTSHNNQMPTWQKNLHAWSVRFLYVILAHVIAGTTLDQWKPPIHVDCHLVGHKPIKILGGDHFMSMSGLKAMGGGDVDFVLFHNFTCYTNPLLSRIHVNTTQPLHVMCTLVATSVILQSSNRVHQP